jgi:acetyl esterase
MAACLTLLLRDIGAPIPTYQIIAYPIVDSSDDWPSYGERGSGYILDCDQIKWFFDNYVPATHDPGDPYLFPLAAPDLSGLPAALVMTAEFDPLRDEGIAYAAKLAEAGVPVEHRHAGDQMHGFLLHSRAIRKASELIDCVGDALALHGRTYRSPPHQQRQGLARCEE